VADLVLLEDEGFVELEDFDEEARAGACAADELWELVAQGDQVGARELLEHAGWDELPEPCTVVAMRVPDAVAGERLRVWIGPASM
jgi:hypothetical protein